MKRGDELWKRDLAILLGLLAELFRGEKMPLRWTHDDKAET